MNDAHEFTSDDALHTTRQASREFLQYIEEQAQQIRCRAGVGPLDRLDPQRVAERLGLTIRTPHDIEGMTDDQRASVDEVTPRQWSGTGIPLPDNKLLVILNPNQTPERAAVTTLEEVAHEHYGHAPAKIIALPSGTIERSFNVRNEQEAYWTAAAALLPAKALAQALWRGQSADDLAKVYGVSVELVEFRIKIRGLWKHYNRRSA